MILPSHPEKPILLVLLIAIGACLGGYAWVSIKQGRFFGAKGRDWNDPVGRSQEPLQFWFFVCLLTSLSIGIVIYGLVQLAHWISA